MAGEATHGVEHGKARFSRQAPYYLPAPYAPYGHPPPYGPPAYPLSPGYPAYEPEYYPSRNTEIDLDLSIRPQQNNGGGGGSGSKNGYYGFSNGNSGNGNGNVGPTSATLLQHFAPATPPKKVIVPVPVYHKAPQPYYG